MLRKIILLACALCATAAYGEVWHARYGVAEVFNFKLYNADGTLDVDEVDAGTEVSLSCNEGAETTATNDFVDEGTFYSISLTAAEMQCERIAVVVAATVTEVFFVQTHSNASAMTPQSDANVTQFGGSAGTFASGVPAVNSTQISGDANAADNLETSFDDTAGPVPWFGIVDQGTAQSATATTVVLRAAAAFADDTLIGRTICVLGSTQGYWQCAGISDSVLTTDTVTVPTWAVTPSGTLTYKIWGTAAGTGSVTVASGGITAASFAAGAIDAAAIAADAGTEIGTAVWATTTRALTILDEDSTTLDLNATAVGSVTTLGNGSGFTAIPWNASWDAEVQSEAEDAINVRLEQQTLADAAVINCTVNTAFFAGSTTTVACILTDRADSPITAASNDLEGRELLILSGAQIYEGRYITDSTWDGANSELRLTLSRALPGTLADAVTAIIR